MEVIWLVHQDAVEGVDYDVEPPDPGCGKPPAWRTKKTRRSESGRRQLPIPCEPGPYSPLQESFAGPIRRLYLEELSAPEQRTGGAKTRPPSQAART